MIRELINERELRNTNAQLEISESWSLAQTVSGPFLSHHEPGMIPLLCLGKHPGAGGAATHKGPDLIVCKQKEP